MPNITNNNKVPLAKVSLRKWYKTREGFPVRLWCIDPKMRMELPVKGHILTRTADNKVEILNGTWTRVGKWPEQPAVDHRKDLVQITEQDWNDLTEALRLL